MGVVHEIVADIRDKYAYCPETGLVTWKAPYKRHWAKPGDPAGSKNGEYLYILFQGKNIAVHRFAWLVMTGSWPEKSIDHKNCNPTDNRWENLREATPAQNCANRRFAHRGKYLPGARRGRFGKFFATIRHEGRQIYLGTFESEEAASQSYLDAGRRLRGEFARLP